MTTKTNDWTAFATRFARHGLELGAEIMGTTAKELNKIAEAIHPETEDAEGPVVETEAVEAKDDSVSTPDAA